MCQRALAHPRLELRPGHELLAELEAAARRVPRGEGHVSTAVVDPFPGGGGESAVPGTPMLLALLERPDTSDAVVMRAALYLGAEGVQLRHAPSAPQAAAMRRLVGLCGAPDRWRGLEPIYASWQMVDSRGHYSRRSRLLHPEQMAGAVLELRQAVLRLWCGEAPRHPERWMRPAGEASTKGPLDWERWYDAMEALLALDPEGAADTVGCLWRPGADGLRSILDPSSPPGRSVLPVSQPARVRTLVRQLLTSERRDVRVAALGWLGDAERRGRVDQDAARAPGAGVDPIARPARRRRRV